MHQKLTISINYIRPYHQSNLNSLISCVKSEMINLITDEAKFNPSLRQFPNARANVAIFGTQSSGKSTLMNTAFGCNFPVLNTKKGRQRCTRGVWFQHNKQQDLNIIDTEGFDSVDRSEETRIVEKQIALFCLAIADIVIVNIWMHQIGRYEGGHNHILKAIIKVSDRLTKSAAKTIIFAVKDCTEDADRSILKDSLNDNFERILQTETESHSLKFELQYIFLDHFAYSFEEYRDQAKKLPSLIKTKKSNLNLYSPQDRLAYLAQIWEKVTSAENQIDLKSEEDALRLYICTRIRNQIVENLEQKLQSIQYFSQMKNYERYLERFIRSVLKEFQSRKPLYLDEKTHKKQIQELESSCEYVCNQRFLEFFLPQEQQKILNDFLTKQLQLAYSSPCLQKIIQDKKIEALESYRAIVQGHRQVKVLAKKFNERINSVCLKYERQVTHIFYTFENKLEEALNEELDRQVATLKFKPEPINGVIQRVCHKYQYKEWEIKIEDAWEKVVHRIIHAKLPLKIEQESQKVEYAIHHGPMEGQIVTRHKDIEKKVEQFCSGLLHFLDEEASIVHLVDRTREKVQSCLEKALQKQRKRFKMSLILIIILLGFLYGEFLFVVSYFPLRKKQKTNLEWLYLGVIMSLVALEIYKWSQHSKKHSKR